MTTDNSKTITAYYDNTLSFDNADDMMRNDSVFITSSFFNLLKDSSTIDCCLDRDLAFDMAIRTAQSTDMPAYLYTLTIEDSPKFIEEEKQLPEDKKEALKKLIQSEQKYQNKYAAAEMSLAIDDKTHSAKGVMNLLRSKFSYEHTVRMMKTIGIDGMYHGDSKGNKTNIALFNRDLITNMEREQVMSPVHDTKFNIAPHEKPEQRIEELLNQEHQYILKKVGQFDPASRPKRHNEDPKSPQTNPDTHLPLYRAEHVHALNNDRNYKKFLFRTIRSEFNDYSYKQFTQDIKLAQDKNISVPCAVIGAINPTKIDVELPQSLAEINDLIPATEDHVSSEQLGKMDEGATKATQLKIRPSDQKMFVIKDLPKINNTGLLTGLKDIVTGVKTGDSSDACRSEHESYQIYEAFGVKVPKTHLIEENGNTVLVLDYIKGQRLDEHITAPENLADIEYLKELRDTIAYDFPIDALLCNPDTGSYHNKNIIVDENTKEPKRFDMGFALAYHAKGHKKDKDEWNVAHIHDFYNFRMNDKASINYGGLNNQTMLDRLQQAEKDMPKVKKAASKENYTIINKRLKKSLSHFKQLCKVEAEFKNNKDSMGITKPQEQKATVGVDLKARAKRIALTELRKAKFVFRL